MNNLVSEVRGGGGGGGKLAILKSSLYLYLNAIALMQQLLGLL